MGWNIKKTITRYPLPAPTPEISGSSPEPPELLFCFVFGSAGIVHTRLVLYF
jgi:hypothetical protein